MVNSWPVLGRDAVEGKPAPYRTWLVFGPQCSGTNLFERLLDINFQQEDLNTRLLGRGRPKIWKHTWDWEMADQRRSPGERDGCARFIVLKRPEFWLASIEKRSYDFKLRRGGGDGGLSTPIVHVRSVQRREPKPPPHTFKDAAEAWSAFIRFYERDSFFSAHTHVVLYEDLLLRPSAVIVAAARLLGRDTRGLVSEIEEAAKPGSSRSRSTALSHYTESRRHELERRHTALLARMPVPAVGWTRPYGQINERSKRAKALRGAPEKAAAREVPKPG